MCCKLDSTENLCSFEKYPTHLKITTNDKDDYDSENSQISDGLPSNSRKRRRCKTKGKGGQWKEKGSAMMVDVGVVLVGVDSRYHNPIGTKIVPVRKENIPLIKNDEHPTPTHPETRNF